MKATNFADVRPNVTWHLFDEKVWVNPPDDFAEKLQPLFSKIYPQEPIRLIQNDGYNPVIIGYEHGNPLSVMRLVALLNKLKKSQSQCKVAMEILPPQALEWIADFLRDEREFNEKGTILGQRPSKGQVADLKAYRGKLAQNHGQALLLWLLENQFPVTSIEHPGVMGWINQDEYESRFVEGKGGKLTGIPWYQLRPFYTAIRRDIHGLGVLEKERPDIVCMGIYHAIKYDLLLGRDGKGSYYFLSQQFIQNQLGWELLRKMWGASHELYILYPPKQ